MAAAADEAPERQAVERTLHSEAACNVSRTVTSLQGYETTPCRYAGPQPANLVLMALGPYSYITYY